MKKLKKLLINLSIGLYLLFNTTSVQALDLNNNKNIYTICVFDEEVPENCTVGKGSSLVNDKDSSNVNFEDDLFIDTLMWLLVISIGGTIAMYLVYKKCSFEKDKK